MSIHGLIDNLAVGLGAKFMPKYFREGLESQSVEENLKNVTLEMPEISGKGDYEVRASTLVGELHPAFRLVQWLGGDHPVIIYHHGASETPFDYGFNKIFPYKDKKIPANLLLIRAPFHQNMKDFQQGIRTLSNIVAMLAVSVSLIEQLVEYGRKASKSKIMVSGTSLGGFITNLHHIHHNSADYYAPLLAGLALDDAYLRSLYSRASAPEAKENPEVIEGLLNFEEDFAAVDSGNVFPLLATHDQLIRYEQQKASYGSCPVEIIAKGHATGALAYGLLRSHILEVLNIEV